MRSARVESIPHGPKQEATCHQAEPQAQMPVDRKQPRAPYLASDGKAARLRPDTQDFTYMSDIFGPLS